jgi:cell division protein FtsW
MKREVSLVLVVVLALTMVGVLTVYSARTVQHYGEGGGGDVANFGPLLRHLSHVLAGTALLLVAARCDYHLLSRRFVLWPVVLGTIALLALVLVAGDDRLGARRWLSIGGFSFQPSEVAKAAVIVLLAVKLSENQKQIGHLMRGFLPPMVAAGSLCILVALQHDLGTPVVIAAVALLMVAMAGTRWAYLFGTGILGALAVAGAIWANPERTRRVLAFLDPWQYRSDDGLQLVESLGAFARGGAWGVGLGAGEQKLFYLPMADCDFIFAVWGEEMGLAGSLVVVGLFALFLLGAMRIALNAPDLLGSLLAGGVAALIAVQGAFNMMVTTGLLPTKGLPLPFVSAGGSAVIVNLALVGVLLSVGLQARETAARRSTAAAH